MKDLENLMRVMEIGECKIFDPIGDEGGKGISILKIPHGYLIDGAFVPNLPEVKDVPKDIDFKSNIKSSFNTCKLTPVISDAPNYGSNFSEFNVTSDKSLRIGMTLYKGGVELKVVKGGVELKVVKDVKPGMTKLYLYTVVLNTNNASHVISNSLLVAGDWFIKNK